ncbi:HNH endonuclease signature motif containing protein, partial [Microbacterium sp. NPDC008134]|uniref:HNH endonuclease signature motif containing protein n=1 Tax=Microbacterium sp. NPDC008134 TaxID=3364183 RepID=UPI0036E48C81
AATTLAGLDDHPAELDGHGPLDPDIARTLAGHNNGWTRLFLDPDGMVTETDTYTPTEPMRRYLRARDQHCRFPGCRMPVHRCELDHNHDHAKGGKTAITNLAHLCRTHHQLKHPDTDPDHRWTAHQHPNGTLHWTSPLGRLHADSAPRRVMFT